LVLTAILVGAFAAEILEVRHVDAFLLQECDRHHRPDADEDESGAA
jgi:hypothetical protein